MRSPIARLRQAAEVRGFTRELYALDRLVAEVPKEDVPTARAELATHMEELDRRLRAVARGNPDKQDDHPAAAEELRAALRHCDDVDWRLRSAEEAPDAQL